MDYRTQHPECRPGETFLGNSTDSECAWKTKRFGKVCYDAEGNVIADACGRRPMFASTEEIKAGLPDGYILSETDGVIESGDRAWTKNLGAP